MTTINSKPGSIKRSTTPSRPVDGAEMQRQALMAAVRDLNPASSPRSKTLGAVPANVMRSNRASELTIQSITRGEPVNRGEIPVRTRLTLTAPDYAGDAVIKARLDLPPGVRLLEGDPSNVVLTRRQAADGRHSYEANLSFAMDPVAQGGQSGGWSAVKPSSLGVTFNAYPPGSENRPASAHPQGPLTYSNVPLMP